MTFKKKMWFCMADKWNYCYQKKLHSHTGNDLQNWRETIY